MIYLRLLREFFLSISQRWTEYIFAEPPLFGPGLSRLGSGFMIQNHFRGSNSKTQLVMHAVLHHHWIPLGVKTIFKRIIVTAPETRLGKGGFRLRPTK